MRFVEDHFWPLLAASFVLFVLSTIIMGRLSRRFFTMGKVRQSFSIFDLEFPSKSSELMKLLRGIDDLPPQDAQNSKAGLRAHLLWDFVFMLGIYPLIFLLCWKASMKMDWIGKGLFIILAWAQVLPLLFDVAENIYLLRKVSKPETSTSTVHKMYLRIVIGKWLIALVGLVCAASGLLYFWMTGAYNVASLRWVGGLLLVFVAGLAVMRAMGGRSKTGAASSLGGVAAKQMGVR